MYIAHPIPHNIQKRHRHAFSREVEKTMRRTQTEKRPPLLLGHCARFVNRASDQCLEKARRSKAEGKIILSMAMSFFWPLAFLSPFVLGWTSHRRCPWRRSLHIFTLPFRKASWYSQEAASNKCLTSSNKKLLVTSDFLYHFVCIAEHLFSQSLGSVPCLLCFGEVVNSKKWQVSRWQSMSLQFSLRMT